MKKLVLALAAAAAFTGSAVAADLPARTYKAPPPPAPVANWTGCYIAGSVGYGMSDNEAGTGFFTAPGIAPFVVSAPHDNGGRGWLAGGGGGCDYQFGFGGGGGIFGTGQFVIGFLGDYYWSDMRGNRGAPSLGNFFTGQEKVDSQWAVGGRIGWLVNPNTLTYFSGGYTEATLTGVGNFSTPIVGFAGTPLGISLPGRTVQGWFLGGGVELFDDRGGIFRRACPVGARRDARPLPRQVFVEQRRRRAEGVWRDVSQNGSDDRAALGGGIVLPGGRNTESCARAEKPEQLTTIHDGPRAKKGREGPLF